MVIDAGSRFDLTDAAWFEQADTAYLVMQAGIPELRNSHRLISEFFKSGTPKLEIVLNRYVKSSMGVDEEHIEKALTKPIAVEDSKRLLQRPPDAERGRSAGAWMIQALQGYFRTWHDRLAGCLPSRKSEKASAFSNNSPLFDGICN